jgi:hypothetical protein
LVLLSGNVVAQGQHIGSGVYACDGAAQAGPCQPGGDDAPSYSAGGPGGYTDDDYEHAPPTGFKHTWNATVTGKRANDNRPMRVFSNEYSKTKEEAERLALDKCKSAGAQDCELLMSFSDQCAATYFGRSGKAYGTSLPFKGTIVRVGYFTDPRLEKKLVKAGRKHCEISEGKGNCELAQMDCSAPKYSYE